MRSRRVLIDNVELVYTPKGVIRSLIRLEALDQNHNSIGRSLQSGRDIRLHELMGGAYWELGFVGGCASVVQDQSISEQVESRATVVDAVSDYGVQIAGIGSRMRKRWTSFWDSGDLLTKKHDSRAPNAMIWIQDPQRAFWPDRSLPKRR